MNFSHTTFKAPLSRNNATPMYEAVQGPEPLWAGRMAPAASGPGSRYCASAWQRAVKRSIDIAGALLFFTLFGPLYLGIVIAIALNMGGPVHYGQKRLGRGGRGFRFYKFRSMHVDADEMLERHLAADPAARLQWSRYQKLDQDPRITPLGRFLRRTSLDEVPQLFNVLKGDMSLVGPRPCMERQRSLYGEHWQGYCEMRPGLTGLWQVSGRNKLTYAQRVELDMRYAAEWSLWLDIKILARTVWVVLSHHGAS